ncbi:transposase [Streptomyces sp. NPDC046759]|uniref:transposase n=1 Tax=Streptomyces sp. NPDC046759 TaxID=3155019 RepID=UPI0033EDE53F
MTEATHMTLSMLAQRIEQLSAQINELNQRLTRLVEHHAPQLLLPVGIGPDSAVTLLITMGDNPDRLNTDASFAALCGVSPIEANAALHRIVFTRLRHDPRTQACLRCCTPDRAHEDRPEDCSGGRGHLRNPLRRHRDGQR